MRDFYKFYYALLMYKEKHGDLKVPQRYTIDDYQLGISVKYVRSGQYRITEEQRKKLDDIGFIWRVNNKYKTFEEVYQMLQKYVEEHGNCNVPENYITGEGVKLGTIVQNIRNGSRAINEKEHQKLNELGFQWRINNREQSFEEVYQMLQKYIKEFGNCNVPANYTTSEGIKLGIIVQSIRHGSRKINENEHQMLSELGFQWKIFYTFDQIYQMLQDYQEKYGHMHIPVNFITEHNVKLGKIASNIRCGHKKISEEQRKKLNSIGFQW